MLGKIDKTPSLAVATGLKIRRIRKSRNMTLMELGTRCNTTPQTMQRLETGTMTLSVHWVEKICRALECDKALLFAPEEDEFAANREAMQKMREEAEALKLRAEQFIRHISAFLGEDGG